MKGVVAPRLGATIEYEEQFINTLRTGVTPSGHELDAEFMPWEDYVLFYDYELKAIWMYLETLPKLEQYVE